MADINEAEELVTAHGLPFNRADFEKILKRYGGYWPVKIQALKEGTVIKPSNALVQISNTDSELPWVTAFIETALLRAVWYPTTVASRSRKIKTIIKRYLERTADTTAGLPFKLHDFGARGVSSRESSYLGGMGHLVNFMGTDTIESIRAARKYYNVKDMPAFSIPAAEHSTITSWTRARESDAYRNMIQQFAGAGKLVAVVSDSYDIYNACANVWPSLKDDLIKAGNTLVIRPDSGIPENVVTDLLFILAGRFGSTVNSKGYKMLPDNIRLIQGDGINKNSVEGILRKLTDNGFSADNVAFGMGGELLQTPNRDTMKFAMKASAAMIDGNMVMVSKSPVGDTSKKSKEGILKVILTENEYRTVDARSEGLDYLEEVYNDCEILRDQNFNEVRELAEVD